MNGLGLQESSNGALEALNAGHNVVSEQLVGLLGFNVHRMQERYAIYYKKALAEGCEFVDYEAVEEIEDFLHNDFEAEGFSELQYAFFEKERKKIKAFLDRFSNLYEGKADIINIRDFVNNMDSLQGLSSYSFEGSFLGDDAYYIQDVNFMISRLPNSIRKLSLRENDLFKLSGENLSELIGALPSELVNLDLGDNRLSNFNIYHLGEVMGKLPENIETINLSENNLYLYGLLITQLIYSFKGNIKSLDLGRNGLGILEKNGFIRLIKSFDSGLLELNLSNNQLNEFAKKKYGVLSSSFKMFIDAMEHLPSGLISLDLTGNNLNDFTAKQLVQLFQCLPEGLKKLNLGFNELGKFSTKELKMIIESIPRSVEYLDLTYNDFGERMEFKRDNKLGIHTKVARIKYYGKSKSDLETIFSALPPNLRYLNLVTNGLNWSSEDHNDMIAIMPSTLKYLDLRGNNIKYKGESEISGNVDIILGKEI